MEKDGIERVLVELDKKEFERLKFLLESVSTEKESATGIPKISRNSLKEKNSSYELADLLVQHYPEQAVEVLEEALDRLPRRDLLGKVGKYVKSREPPVPRQPNPRHERKLEYAAEGESHLERYEMGNQRVAFMMCVTKNRDGFEQDIKKMEKLFETCRFKTPLPCCKDPSKKDLMDDLKKFRKHIDTSTSCCLIILMSHGRRDHICDLNGEEINLDEIFSLFNNIGCPELQRKPKIFIIQAFRGTDKDTGAVEADTQTEAKRKLPTASDYFIVYWSQKGLVSLRHPEKGSVTITAMDEVFSAHWQNWHIWDLFTEVNSKMVKQDFWLSDDTVDTDTEDTVKVCSVIESTLTKALFLK
ncbi:caspase-14-like [Candoia aspera]|uniref:caspase-14-like n=1 Tax=Candoia aspera TaxID=51853 RepID=UPI002FD8079C